MRRNVLLAAAALGLAAMVPAAAQDDKVVDLKDDKFRRLALENAKVRVWEVHVPIGESSPFHEHKLDMVNVRINSTEVTNFPKGGLFSFTSDMRLESGSVSYSEYSKSPYVHRISPKGPNAHRVIEFEILVPPGTDTPAIAERPGVKTVLDNRRARAFRVLLEPGQSVDLAPLGNTLVVVIKGGVASQHAEGGAATPKELKPADVQWHAEPGKRSIRNDGTTALELVEVAVR
jgi:hypothetical protein